MKKILFVVSAILLVAMLVFITKPTPVQADGVINWTGNGSENLPCTNGGHWVLAPSSNITGGTGYVNGASYQLTQNSNGSWWFDSSGPIDENSTASVSYIGNGDSQNHLQLSHCIGGTETPPTETPPTETPPTETVTETPPTETVTETPPTVTVTPPTDPTPTATPVPTTPVPFEPPTVSGTPDLLPVTGADFASGGGGLPMFAVVGLVGVAMTVLGFKNRK